MSDSRSDDPGAIAPAEVPAEVSTELSAEVPAEAPGAPPRKGPLSFLSGALTSALLGWFAFGLSRRVVAWYATHPPHYSSPVAQSIATAVKTLVVGMSFLATFTFAFIGLGLFLTFLRSLLPAGEASPP